MTLGLAPLSLEGEQPMVLSKSLIELVMEFRTMKIETAYGLGEQHPTADRNPLQVEHYLCRGMM
jgi:hypothetical protein